MKKFLLKQRAAACAAALVGVGCVAGCRSPRFGNMMSQSDEVQLGQQTAKEIEQKAKIITSGPQYDALQRAVARIIPLARKDYDVPYTVKLIDSKEVNAFALPGGPIYFYKGLIDLAGSDDEIASVLGHEATHVVKRHVAKQISDAQAKNIIASLALGRSSSIVQTVAGLGLQIDQLHYSRQDEAQADEIGFKYLTEAGYNPDAMAGFFKKLETKEGGGGGGGPVWLQDHPLTKSRVQKAEARADEYEEKHPASINNTGGSANGGTP